ncbi:hypothetical protein [Halalkalicoccus jeotgali]|uniref:Uncharacterized protein n=1 Tax=Halalkalicoccus jeotgali (strain DSM 18796 / CECT 7217 / JCM 14584 / KCTC 4019 / B3) TaxID=795797 RepID=D8J5P9_HALJB|nr:hypothetical protein [Halalkalicoccus jeotgali]ADJ13705.1 hypothetical protein HacjB3_01560 [Halalkalicoccus jeotgali B3]ELY34248.1 hypothetical protein C497_17762 [Halalkalicoccus jeotgali B3]
MTEIDSERASAVADWPTFALRYTFDPASVGLEGRFEPDEVVAFDATRGRPEDRWIAAQRGSYVSIEESR